MDVLSEKINLLLGVYPDDMRRRSTIAIFMAILGAVVVLIALLYTFSSFTSSVISAAGGLKQTTQASQGIGMFLMVMYALFMGSLMYYVFLPWKSRKRSY